MALEKVDLLKQNTSIGSGELSTTGSDTSATLSGTTTLGSESIYTTDNKVSSTPIELGSIHVSGGKLSCSTSSSIHTDDKKTVQATDKEVSVFTLPSEKRSENDKDDVKINKDKNDESKKIARYKLHSDVIELLKDKKLLDKVEMKLNLMSDKEIEDLKKEISEIGKGRRAFSPRKQDLYLLKSIGIIDKSTESSFSDSITLCEFRERGIGIKNLAEARKNFNQIVSPKTGVQNLAAKASFLPEVDADLVDNIIEVWESAQKKEQPLNLSERDYVQFAAINFCAKNNPNYKIEKAYCIVSEACETDVKSLSVDLCTSKTSASEAQSQMGKLCQYNGHKMAFAGHILAKHRPSEAKEECYIKAAEASEALQEKTLEIIDESKLKEIYNADDYEKILDSTDACVDSAFDDLNYYIKKENLPSEVKQELIRKLEDKKAQVIEKLETRKQEIIQKHIAYLERKIEVKERILEHRKEVFVKRQEEQKIAKTNVAKAKATAKFWLSFAKKAIAWLGLNDLNIEAKREIIAKKDPKLKFEIDSAKEHYKWFKEDEATANFKARMAELDVDYTEISLGYTKAQHEIVMMNA